MYLYAVENYRINSITHKYLIRGHTQNEGDAVHNVIEKSLKKLKKSGPIYVPEQYVFMIRNAKKKGNSYIVKEMNFNDFIDLKRLSEELGFNYTKNSDGKQFKISEVKMLRFVKGNNCYHYKISYKDDNWLSIPLKICGTRRSEAKSQRNINLHPAYDSKREISENKKRDLKSLLEGNIIPKFYETFFNTLF